MTKTIWFLLVVFHFAIIFGMVAAFFVLPFKADWYVALPCMAFIAFLTTNRVTCILTKLENHLRVKLGMDKIGGFIGHYMVRPTKEILCQKRMSRTCCQ